MTPFNSGMTGFTLTFTVFTATFNRASTLPRTYSSLQAQTCRDFEWLIVDDGSTDGTAALVSAWQAEAAFPIRYVYQENGGKHTAFNLGVRQAHGGLFVTLDSDDTCFPEALETFDRRWHEIPLDVRPRFANLTALCADEDGTIVGRPFPSDVVDAWSVGDQLSLRSQGERWGVNRTDVLRAFPFPVFEDENWVPEGVIWNRIAERYASRFLNRPLRVYRRTAGSLSAGAQLPLRVRNPRGTRLYYQELLALPVPVAWRLRGAVNYCRFGFHAGVTATRSLAGAASPTLAALALPFGYAAYRRDRNQVGQTVPPQRAG